MSKITNSKHQITNKSQITNSKPVQRAAQVLAPRERLFFFVWDFEFRSRAAQALAPRVVICLFFEICYLGFQ
ncbi:MAG: hypothetical protein JRF62_08510 [Deltaproteobacteria bacterium]|nr:hypothetical protein [Deltaproteobacteria bacterium]